MEYSSTGGIFTGQSKTNTVDASTSHANGTVIANSENSDLTLANGKATVKVTTQFFEAGSGDYYIAAYLVEDKAKNIQNGQTGSVEHHYVFRNSFDGPWGKKINKTGSMESEEFNLETVFDDTWIKANMKVITVIYKKNGTKYDFVNAND